jgi:hypothetical protein
LIKSQVLYRLSYGLSPPGPYGCVATKVNTKDHEREGVRALQGAATPLN